MKETYEFQDLLKIVATLRGDGGCPWDQEQTHDSLKPCMIEEAYEVCEAIDIEKKTGDAENLCEELGDVLLQVVMHSQIAEEESKFTMNEVINGVSQKMIRRHPHVFQQDDSKVLDSAQLLEQWDEIKKTEKKKMSLEETLETIPKAFPAIIRTDKVQKQAQKIGLGITDLNQCIQQIKAALNSIEYSGETGEKDSVLGDFETLLFNTVYLARFLQLNAENSLTNATNKFINRLIDVEHLAMASGAHLCDMSIEELNALWDQVNNNQIDYNKEKN